MLIIRNLNLNYDSTRALDAFSLTLSSGETCAVLGPSGCGKTSLLNIIAGVVTHHSGEVTLDGEPIDHRRKTIGLISQDYGLLPWMTAYQNIVLPLKIKKLDVKQYTDKIDYLLSALDIAHLKARYPLSLSGGQRQRIAIASAFLLDLDLLLMDEPFSALDQITREVTQNLFFRIWEASKPSTIFVTHSIDEAVFLGQKIVLLSKAPGSILKIIENPTFGQADARMSEAYVELCRQIRNIINSEWDSE